MAIAFVQTATNSSTAAGQTSLTLTMSSTSGNMLVVGVRQGTNNTDNFTISDSAGNVWAQTPSGYVTAATTNRAGLFYAANAAAVTSITVNFSTVGGVTTTLIICFEISGAASLDASVNISGASQSGLTSGSLTTSQADAILVYYCGEGADETAWTAGSGYAIPNNNVANGANGSNVRGAMQYKVVSAVQSAVTTIMSWTPGVGSASGIFVAFKALLVAGCVGDDVGWSLPLFSVFSAYDAAKHSEESCNWTNRVILPSAGGIAQQMEDYQAHEVIAGRHYPTPQPARQFDEMSNWTEFIILPSFAPNSDEWDGRSYPSPLPMPDHYAEQGFSPALLIPPFDPTSVPQSEQTDVYGVAWRMLEEADSPLNIFLPPPGWDDGFDFSFQPTVKLEQYGEEGNSPIIPAAFDDDFLFSFQPQMRIDDDREYLMRIFIPTEPWDDDWQMATQPQVKIDDERDYQVRIFLPKQAWDDDWQSLVMATVKLEDADSPLQLFLPPFDPTIVRDGEQIQQTWPQGMRLDDQRDYQMRLFIPVGPWDDDGQSLILPTARLEEAEWTQYVILPPVTWTDDWQVLMSPIVQLEEVDSPLQLFLPPFDPVIVRDEQQQSRPQLSWQLSVEPEGEWFNFVVVLPPPVHIPQAVFELYRGVRIRRGIR